MIGHFDGLADDLAQCAKSGEKAIREKYHYENEDSLSMRFLDSFSDEIEKYDATTPYNLEIDTYKLNDKGPNSPETRFGPDFVVGYLSKISNLTYSTGIMVQAKKGNISDFSDLRGQCEDMLDCTPDSFLYQFSQENSRRSYRMFPALQIARTAGDGPEYSGNKLEFFEAYESRTTLKFYRLFFEGYIGDNWVYRNLKYFPNPDRHDLVDRPVVPDGGAPPNDQRRGGANVLVISVKEPGEEIELPFSDEDTTDSFKRSGFGGVSI